MDLEHRTLQGLDWPILLEAWAGCARTTLGVRAIEGSRPLPDRVAIERAWDAAEELRRLEDSGTVVPVGDVADIEGTAGRAEKGQVLDGPSLLQAGRTLSALVALERVLHRHAEQAPVLAQITSVIELDPFVVDELTRAFDATGALSSRTYPQLGELRQRIASLHSEVRATLDRLVKGSESLLPAERGSEDVLQDRYWTQRDNRYVLPVKAHAKRWDLGIVHGTSGSGQTVYIEPHAVIALNNRLRVAEGELAAEEHRILAALSAALATVAQPVREALAAATEVDLAAARERFGRRLQGIRPICREQGRIDLRGARHPVLALRGVEVVANDLRLGMPQSVLVISGPNAGGKTVALKTVGLSVLLVAHGLFVPAEEGSRVDRFDQVLAAIGDDQTVQEDLSSFSGHLVSLREILKRAGPGTLALLDEIASGTDPTQGAALAQAVLEALAGDEADGPRVVVTTHFARLKGLATTDPRFSVAAMQYLDGKPTYRVIPDATGESHALSIAATMGLPSAILDRATALLGQGEGRLSQVLEDLDAERGRLQEAAAAQQAAAQALADREAQLRRKEAQIARRARQLEQQGAEAFLERLAGAEKAIGQVVADLQRAPDHRKVAAARASVDAMRGLVPARPTPEREQPAPDLEVGDRVRLRDLNQIGEVVGIRGDQVQVRAGAITVKTRAAALERLAGTERPAPPRKGAISVEYTPRDPKLDEAVRVDANTLDLRGKRVDEAEDLAERFFDRCLRQGWDVVFLLHGHGTGALKEGLRGWLRSSAYVKDWAIAAEDQGGDAFTVVHLGR